MPRCDCMASRIFRFLLLFCFLTIAVSALPPSCAAASASVSQLEKDLAREQEKAAERRRSLQRLTEQERKLNADLAAAEKRILDLERNIASQQTKLRELDKADGKVRIEYEALLAEQAKTEEAQTQTLRLLWEAVGKRIAVGGREAADWTETDREYAWSRELYASLEKYREQLNQQEVQLARLLGRRDTISRDVQRSVRAVNEEKSKLLQVRIEYDRRLAELRRQRTGTEAELQNILQLVDSLNLALAQRSGGDIASMKGRLPRPVSGKVQVRYAPRSNPASRGVGFSTAERAEVVAVADGTVVHNDVLRGFGTVLILQHGEEYYSLYAFLDNSPMTVGQNVTGRQSIGTVGYYPLIQGPGLYFELRFKQNAINPEPWFAS